MIWANLVAWAVALPVDVASVLPVYGITHFGAAGALDAAAFFAAMSLTFGGDRRGDFVEGF
jgi:hypothetical protein